MDFNISEVVEKLADALKRKRETSGLTLKAVSAETGLSISTLIRVEGLKAKPDSDTISALAGYLEIPLARLYREDLSMVVVTDRPLPGIIAGFLQQDETLNSEGREFLIRFFSRTYEQFVEIEESRRVRQFSNICLLG